MLPLQKVILNLIYTYNWHQEQTAKLFEEVDLTPQQYNVLRILRGRHPQPLSAGEVKEVMLDKSPDLTRLCDRLCRKGLVKRDQNPDNRRQVLINITDAGLGLLEQIEPQFAEAAKKWDNLTDEEAERLSDLLDKLRG